jgi:hypothetical protein
MTIEEHKVSDAYIEYQVKEYMKHVINNEGSHVAAPHHNVLARRKDTEVIHKSVADILQMMGFIVDINWITPSIQIRSPP